MEGRAQRRRVARRYLGRDCDQHLRGRRERNDHAFRRSRKDLGAANERRAYYDSYYHAPRYGYYEAPAYGYYGGGYAGPPAYQYAPPAYHSRPVYQQRDYYSRWGGSGGQPGYRGPNVNVPGPTNYGNAAGQNGQQSPTPGHGGSVGGSN